MVPDMFPLESEVVLPLFLYFDDFTLGNVLGSRAGKSKIGGVYVSIPCWPPQLFSNLDSLFLFALFKSNDRKDFGNKATFATLISELQ